VSEKEAITNNEMFIWRSNTVNINQDGHAKHRKTETPREDKQ
jgi:hypothetical protein